MTGNDKGIIYLMETAVNGLVKIGRCESFKFENRMYELEKNGFSNITGLKRYFAIEVDSYKDKEKLIHQILGRSRVSNTEFFSLDKNLGKQLLSALDGNIIYPQTSKEEVFEEATDAVETLSLSKGTYHLNGKSRKGSEYNATIKYENGQIILLKGSTFAPVSPALNHSWLKERSTLDLEGNKLNEDHVCSSVSMAASIVVGHNVNGWLFWKDDKGEVIDAYRQKEEIEDE